MSVVEAVQVTTPADQRTEAWRLMGGAVNLAGCQSTDEVLERANLNWEAELHPVHTYFKGEQIPVPDRKAVVRSDSGLVLGDVGKSFAPVQNRELVEFGRTLRDEASVDWDAGGTIKNSQIAFLSFKVPNSILVAGEDEVESWVLLSNGHNGSHALRASVIPHRISCGNQVGGAFRRAKASYSIRHVGDVQDKVAEVRSALGLVSNYMSEFEAIANRLADIDVDIDFFEDFVGELIPLDPEAGARTNAGKARQRALLTANWKATETLSPDLKETGWGALNVVTEVIDHGNLDARKSKQDRGERRFLSSLEGPGATLRNRAFDLLLGEVEEPGRVREAARERRLLLAR